MQLLNGLSFFLTILLLTLDFYLGWADEGGITLLGVSLFVPYLFVAPLVVGTCLIRDVRDSAPKRAIPSALSTRQPISNV